MHPRLQRAVRRIHIAVYVTFFQFASPVHKPISCSNWILYNCVGRSMGRVDEDCCGFTPRVCIGQCSLVQSLLPTFFFVLDKRHFVLFFQHAEKLAVETRKEAKVHSEFYPGQSCVFHLWTSLDFRPLICPLSRAAHTRECTVWL